MDAKQIIQELGGTAETARLCDVSMSAVSQWKLKNEIPRNQLRFIKLVKKELFKPKKVA